MMPRKPFSGKAKKAQLQAKRERKAAGDSVIKNNSLLLMKKFKNDPETDESDEVVLQSDSKSSKSNRYKLKFKVESKRELAENRDRAQQKIIDVTDLSSQSEMYFDSCHDFPRRQEWDKSWSKDKLERSEQKYFREYVDNIMKLSEDDEASRDFSYFELNLETWRQLWRVIEMSDVILMILDVRYATATFPPSLYDYVVKEKQKHFVLVLNKCDLIEPEVCVAWKKYFIEKYSELHVVFFTSFPSYNSVTVRSHGIKMKRHRANFKMAKEGALQIHDICQSFRQIDLSSWKEMIMMNGKSPNYENEAVDEENCLTLGTIGHPNVGKSSLLNSLIGKKRVSVSKTPGHTKHFQTIFLTKNVRLCDCPGLVFPSKVPKPLQVIMGSFPIAQVREPLSVVNYLAERLDLPKILKLQMEPGQKYWSAFLICNAWAEIRRFFTSRTSRPDVFRAANEILRMALEGRLCLTFYPPGYDLSLYEDDLEARFVREIVGDDKENLTEECSGASEDFSHSSDDSSDDESDEELETTSNTFAILNDCDD